MTRRWRWSASASAWSAPTTTSGARTRRCARWRRPRRAPRRTCSSPRPWLACCGRPPAAIAPRWSAPWFASRTAAASRGHGARRASAPGAPRRRYQRGGVLRCQLGAGRGGDRGSLLHPKLAAGLSWLGAALAADDVDGEAAARRFVAAELEARRAPRSRPRRGWRRCVDQPQCAARLREWRLCPGTADEPRAGAAGLRSPPPRGGAARSRRRAGRARRRSMRWRWPAGPTSPPATPTGARSFQAVVENRPEDSPPGRAMRARRGAARRPHGGRARRGAARRAVPRRRARRRVLGEGRPDPARAHRRARRRRDRLRARLRARRRAARVAFDKLFRRVRARNEDDRLLDDHRAAPRGRRGRHRDRQAVLGAGARAPQEGRPRRRARRARERDDARARSRRRARAGRRDLHHARATSPRRRRARARSRRSTRRRRSSG